MTDENGGSRMVEIKRKVNAVAVVIYEDIGHGGWSLAETATWTDDEMPTGETIAVGEAVELKRTGDGIGATVYEHGPNRSRVLEEGFWTNAELEGMGVGTVLLKQGYDP